MCDINKNCKFLLTVFVSEAYNQRFVEAQIKFGTLCHDIFSMIANKVPLTDEFKKYLQRCFPGLNDELVNATSIEDAIDAVERKCSIINIAPLEAITNRYKITEAKEMIREYKKAINEFCSEMKVKFLLDKKLSLAVSSLTCERVEFVLEWKPDEHTLDDIRRLLIKAFEELNKRIIVRSIHEGKSISIICYAPHHLLAALILEAKDNLTVLIKEFNLISLTIGHYTVYSKRIRYKV